MIYGQNIVHDSRMPETGSKSGQKKGDFIYVKRNS